MTVTTTLRTQQELRERLEELLCTLGVTERTLNERRASGSMTPDEWTAWEEIEAIRYLLG